METALYKKALHGYMHRSKKITIYLEVLSENHLAVSKTVDIEKFIVARQIKLIDFAFCHFC